MYENGLECRDNDNKINKIRNAFFEYPRLSDPHVASKIGEKLGTDITLKIVDKD